MKGAESMRQNDEAPLEPYLPIIDAHHHIWRQSDLKSANHTLYTLPDFLADMAGHNVVSTVFADCGAGYRTDGPEELRPVGETEFARSMAEEVALSHPGGPRLCEGVVSRADLRLGAAAGEVLDAHIAAGGGAFKGVRVLAACADIPDVPGLLDLRVPGVLQDPQVRLAVREVAARGLVLDVWVLQNQLSEFAAFADSLPDLSMVLNHLGGRIAYGRYAERPQEAFAQWQDGLSQVALRQNVSLKLGGFGMSPDLAAHGQESSQAMANAWRPVFETCIDVFGPDRCMFESNFPVDARGGSYRKLWNAFKRLSAGYSATERAQLFGGVAARVYSLEGWGPPHSHASPQERH